MYVDGFRFNLILQKIEFTFSEPNFETPTVSAAYVCLPQLVVLIHSMNQSTIKVKVHTDEPACSQYPTRLESIVSQENITTFG